jgi:nicotinamidase-related amidase
MPLTKLDSTAALIVIDLQKGVVNLPTAHPVGGVVKNASTLADEFRRHGLPVVLVTVTGTPPGRTDQAQSTGQLNRQFPAGWADLVPELNYQPADHAVTKQTWGAFTNTDLAEHLKTTVVTQIAIAGVTTSLGVESTARQAHELGFNVALAVDAMTDRNADAHTNSITRIFPRLGETTTTQEILGLLKNKTGPA